jgi:hypothetical protein
MSGTPRVGDLEIDQDLGYEKAAWKVRRAGSGLMIAIVLAALSGLFGTGPLSHTVTGGPSSPLRLEYGRFERFTSPSQLKVHLGPAATPGREARVWISRQYLQGLKLESVIPEPREVEAGADRLVMIFPLAEPGRGTSIELEFQPQKAGLVRGRVGVEGGPSVPFRQFVYP